MAENKIYPSSQTYVYMLESLAHGGHIDLLGTVWERIQDVESLTEDIKPLIMNCICNGYYGFAFELIKHTTTKTSSSKNSYHYYIERRLFNIMYYCRKVRFIIHFSINFFSGTLPCLYTIQKVTFLKHLNDIEAISKLLVTLL